MMKESNSESYDIPFWDMDIVEAVNSKKTYIVNGDNLIEKDTPKDMTDVGYITFRFNNPTKYFLNGMGSIHGGAFMTWVDIVTTTAIVALDPHKRVMSVSLSLTQDFLNAGKEGEPLFMKAIIRKLGKTIAFTECIMMNEKGKVLSTATHKKAFV